MTASFYDGAPAAAALGRLGIVKLCSHMLPLAGSPKLFAVCADPSSAQVLFGQGVVGRGSGIGLTEREAVDSAIGECLERYACAYVDRERLVRASGTELGEHAVGLDAFSFFNDKQYAHAGFPFAKWDPDATISWVRGRSLPGGEPRFVPAGLVFVPYEPYDEADLLFLAVSTGQALHADPRLAAISGLCETIERDAFAITWLRKLSAPRVDLTTDDAIRTLYDRYFAGCGVEHHVFDITLDIGVPTFLCFAESRTKRGPIFGTGAATRPDERTAVTKALLEATHTLMYARELVDRRPDWKPAPDFVDVRQFEDHVRLYCEPHMKAELGFLLDSPNRRALGQRKPAPEDIDETLAWCIEQVRAVGLEVIEVDITPPDIASLGQHALKLFAPGAVPLMSVHALQPAGCERLFTVPERLGLEPGCERINMVPHSFP